MNSADAPLPCDLPHGVQLVHVVSAEDYPPAGGAFVWNGEGLGKLRWARATSNVTGQPNNADHFLMLGHGPILHWQAVNECPACEQLLQAGNCSERDIDQFAAAINRLTNDLSIRECLVDLSPAVQLLPQGFYFVSFDDYLPTNGEGRFFWRAFGELTSCMPLRWHWLWSMDDESHTSYIKLPTFLVPTQSTANFDAQRFAAARLSYREQPGLALFIGGRMSALLYGHHRATCAAMYGEKFRVLTISRAALVRNRTVLTLVARHVQVPWNQVNSMVQRQMNIAELERPTPEPEQLELNVDAYHAQLQKVIWPPLPKWITDVINPARYMNDEQFNSLSKFNRSEEPIEQTMIEDALISSDDQEFGRSMLSNLLKALFAVEDPRAVATAIRVAQSPGWVSLWRNAYELLATVRCEEVENQFVDFLVNDDGTRPEIKAIVDLYFEQMS